MKVQNEKNYFDVCIFKLFSMDIKLTSIKLSGDVCLVIVLSNYLMQCKVCHREKTFLTSWDIYTEMLKLRWLALYVISSLSW